MYSLLRNFHRRLSLGWSLASDVPFDSLPEVNRPGYHPHFCGTGARVHLHNLESKTEEIFYVLPTGPFHDPIYFAVFPIRLLIGSSAVAILPAARFYFLR